MTKASVETYMEWMNAIRYGFIQYGLPEATWNALDQYLQRGTRPGHFLLPLLENNFAQTVLHADDDNADRLKQWAQFMQSHMPVLAWGSQSKVHKWRSAGGWRGLLERGHDPSTAPIGGGG